MTYFPSQWLLFLGDGSIGLANRAACLDAAQLRQERFVFF